jgi:uncharacterized iron-regulated membrane protein
VLGVLFELHHDLFLGLAGHWILAGAAAVWLLLTLIGVYLAIKQAGGVRRALRVDARGGGRRLLLELHRSLGLAGAVAMVALAVSGIYLNLRPEFTALVELFSPVSVAPERAWPNRPLQGTSVGFERAMAEAESAVLASRTQSISLNRAKGFYRVRIAVPGDVNERGDTFAYVGAEDGRLLEVRNVMSGSAGDVFLAWQRPLHSGEALGPVGRGIVFVVGLLPAFLAGSGITLWLRRTLGTRGTRAAFASAPDQAERHSAAAAGSHLHSAAAGPETSIRRLQ